MRWMVGLVVMATLSGCVGNQEPAPASPGATVEALDPLAPGSIEVTSLTWSSQPMVAFGRPAAGPLPAGAYPVDMAGTMHIPAVDNAPVALLMHGRHATCRVADAIEVLGKACPDAAPATAPVPNAHGYEYLGEFLASHGIFTISVNANNVNDWDNEFSTTGDDYGATGRATVIAHTLRELARANAGTSVEGWPDLRDRLDLSRVGLMGHSRGGEGVMAATHLVQEGELDLGGAVVKAVFALAPTDFARWDFDTVAFATLLPYCDGDVSNLQGAWAYDDNRRNEHAGFHQFLALGANHNFYNTVWTNDDFGNRGDPWCDADATTSGRDTPEAQRQHGLMLMGSFFRAYLQPQEALRPFLEGREPWPLEGIQTTYHPSRSGHRLFHWLTAEGDHADDGVFTGPIEITSCHGTSCPAERTLSQAAMLRIEWNGDASWQKAYEWAPQDRMTLRVAVDPTTATEVLRQSTMVLAGNEVSLYDLGLRVLPGESHRKTVLQMIELPMGDQGMGIEFHLRGAGALQLADGLNYSSK